jgi:pyruvate/oxaloacetate carboxyltransferase
VGSHPHLQAADAGCPAPDAAARQNLVGYRHYADDVVRAFVAHAAECGIDVFRVFDALNDERNFATAFQAIHDAGKHIQGAISYSLTERSLGGPVFTLDYFVDKARTLERMGADSLCIKDMAGLLSPDDAAALVGRLNGSIDRGPHPFHERHGVCRCCAYRRALTSSIRAWRRSRCARRCPGWSRSWRLAGRPRDAGLDVAP